jgi:ubiquinone/menaquinone biosynthesis C-methylase UbiE
MMENIAKKGIPIKAGAFLYDLYSPTEKSRYRERIINYADLKAGERVLEVGCGTGTLSLLAKRRVDDGEVIGLDLSPKMVKQAEKKSKKYNLDIKFIEGSIDTLLFPDNYFDVVLSSWMFHHLPIRIKREGLKEIHRVLKKGGRFLFFDFSKPNNVIGYMITPLFIWTDFLREHIFGDITSYFKESGFSDITLKRKGICTAVYLMYKK